MSNKKAVKVTWDANLQISRGDEVKILRGIVHSEDNITASVIENITRGRRDRSRIEGVIMASPPTDIEPPIRGIVESVDARSNETQFDLVVGVGVIEVALAKLLNEASKFLDKDVVKGCIHKKDAEDVVTSAFRILEERIRTKIGVNADCHGVDLVAKAFSPKEGKLTFGKTSAEREGLFHLFRSSILFLRNPPSHRFIREYSAFEIFEMVCLVNLLLNILEKSQVRTERPEEVKMKDKRLGKKQHREARTKDYQLSATKEVYGPLYGSIKSVVLPLEQKWYRQIQLDVWREMQDDERYFIVDKKFRGRLDRFYKKLENYNNNVFKLRSRVVSDIVNEEGKRIFKTSFEKMRLRIEFLEKKEIHTQDCSMVECLISKTHPKDYVLRKDSERELFDFKVYFGQAPADSRIVENFDELWEACLARMEEDGTYRFVIQENENLLEEAKELKEEMVKRIEEALET